MLASRVPSVSAQGVSFVKGVFSASGRARGTQLAKPEPGQARDHHEIQVTTSVTVTLTRPFCMA
jgi:hypothetical protein